MCSIFGVDGKSIPVGRLRECFDRTISRGPDMSRFLEIKRGYLGFKLNSLTDKVLMDKLIEASCAGVRVEMVIRGINCLIPGIPGKTENITVRSIVGRFLEHSRIYIFGEGDREKIFISSADFMTRNTTRRVEIAAPVLSPDIKKHVRYIFRVMLSDNTRAWIQKSDGTYRRVVPDMDEPLLAAQDFFIGMVQRQAAESAISKPTPAKPVTVVARKIRRKKN